jgi:hypothetical protein
MIFVRKPAWQGYGLAMPVLLLTDRLEVYILVLFWYLVLLPDNKDEKHDSFFEQTCETPADSGRTQDGPPFDR